MESEAYRLTSITSDGVEIVNFALPTGRRHTKRMMMEEYGNVEQEGLLMSEVPDDVRADMEAVIAKTQRD